MIEGMSTGCGVVGERERGGGVWRMVGMVKDSDGGGNRYGEW